MIIIGCWILIILVRHNKHCCLQNSLMKDKILIGLLLFLSVSGFARDRKPPADSIPTKNLSGRQLLDKQIAAQFAPLIYQGLGDEPRADYITNFDFDGDWKGDNNWNNLDNRKYHLRAFVYYSLLETITHYFIFYANFHPRDYKGGGAKTSILDTLIKEGIRRAGKDPTGLADDIALSHENDLEGCLVVVEKHGANFKEAVVVYVEAMAHHYFNKYRTTNTRSSAGELIDLQEQHPMIFSEPKGHGVFSYSGSREQLKKSNNGVLMYEPKGRADDADEVRGKSLSYDLISLQETLWKRAEGGTNDTFGEAFDYGKIIVTGVKPDGKETKFEKKFGKIGTNFLGNVGFKNKARPPWSWYDEAEKDRPPGEWFFNPAAIIAQHFSLEQKFSLVYVYHPFLRIGVAEPGR